MFLVVVFSLLREWQPTGLTQRAAVRRLAVAARERMPRRFSYLFISSERESGEVFHVRTGS